MQEQFGLPRLSMGLVELFSRGSVEVRPIVVVASLSIDRNRAVKAEVRRTAASYHATDTV